MSDRTSATAATKNANKIKSQSNSSNSNNNNNKAKVNGGKTPKHAKPKQKPTHAPPPSDATTTTAQAVASSALNPRLADMWRGATASEIDALGCFVADWGSQATHSIKAHLGPAVVAAGPSFSVLDRRDPDVAAADSAHCAEMSIWIAAIQDGMCRKVDEAVQFANEKIRLAQSEVSSTGARASAPAMMTAEPAKGKGKRGKKRSAPDPSANDDKNDDDDEKENEKDKDKDNEKDKDRDADVIEEDTGGRRATETDVNNAFDRCMKRARVAGRARAMEHLRSFHLEPPSPTDDDPSFWFKHKLVQLVMRTAMSADVVYFDGDDLTDAEARMFLRLRTFPYSTNENMVAYCKLVAAKGYSGPVVPLNPPPVRYFPLASNSESDADSTSDSDGAAVSTYHSRYTAKHTQVVHFTVVLYV